MAMFQQLGNATYFFYPAEGGGTLANLNRGSHRGAVLVCSYLGEESCGWYFLYTLLTSLFDQGRLVIPMGLYLWNP